MLTLDQVTDIMNESQVKPKTRPAFQCSTCKKSFERKSSLVRHSKICPISTVHARQRSCIRCASSKIKCDLQRPGCGRCTSRDLSCIYKSSHRSPGPPSTIGAQSPVSPDSATGYATPPGSSSHVHAVGTTGLGQTPPMRLDDEFPTSNLPTPPSVLSFDGSGTGTGSGLGTSEVSFAFLMNFFSSDSGNQLHSCPLLHPETWHQTVDVSHAPRVPFRQHSMEFSFRVLRTWPRMMTGALRSPPLFHHTQLVQENLATPLAHCFTIVKMWQGQGESDRSAGLIHDTAVRELTRLFQNYKSFTPIDLVAALQALSIYMIILLFPTGSASSIPIIHMAILANVQKLVNYIGTLGLILPEETNHTRPPWEAWITVTSRRRALFSLYLIHWSLSTYYGLPPLNCDELAGMLAPASKLLWDAKDEQEWEGLYDGWLGEWGGVEYRHGEVAEIGEGIYLDERGEKWLGETDELGLLLMALGERAKLDKREERAAGGDLAGDAAMGERGSCEMGSMD
ncbi:hypothetical protein BJX70DRAFT_400246 [Aspergillus crustosus]